MEKKATIKEIKYGGFTETPSDYECPDGDLATVSGLVPEDEALRPVQQPRREFTLPPNSGADYWTVAYIHRNTGYKHYIVRHHTEVTENNDTTITDSFYWMDKPPVGTVFVDSNNPGEGETTFDTTKLLQSFEGVEIYQVNATGNALMILTDDGMYFFLWKGETDGYKVLGNHMPEIWISFGLQGAAEKTQENFVINIDSDVITDERNAYGQDFPGSDYTIQTTPFAKALTDVIMAKVNTFVAEKSVEGGKFMFPFLVRFAYRLFDNESFVMQSCPVLMITDTYCSPHVFVRDRSGDPFVPDPSDPTRNPVYDGYMLARLGGMLYDLDYKVSGAEGLADWTDIIKSVDIFISEPVYTYDQSGKIKGWDTKDNDDRGFGVFNIPNQNSTYVQITHNDAYSRYYTSRLIVSSENKTEFTLPLFSYSEMQQKIRDVHNFYLLKSIPVDELPSARTKIEVPEKYLANLSGRELLTDDFQSHDLLIPRYSYTYNSRNIIANISRELLNPFSAAKMFCHSYKSQAGYNQDETDPNATYDVYIFIRENDREFIIKGETSQLGFHDPALYLYYPNPNAYKAVIVRRATGVLVYERPLTRHDFLNGTVFFEGWSPSFILASTPTPTTDNIVDMPNKIYVSEVNNPFVFTSKGVLTVGIGTILGIRPAIKAVSPSQYGQYDLYGFTTDGIYVMKVTSEGYLDPPSPVTPDIVNGLGESITQIDGSVVFATGRGVMMTSGSTTICMSDILNSKQPFVPFGASADKDVLPGLRNIVPAAILASVQPVRFLDYIKDCRMVYDYTHQRILIFNPAQPYAYVYSLKSKQWGMIPSAMQQPVFDYPSATVMVRIIETVSVGGVDTTVEKWALYDFAEEVEASADSQDSAVYQGLIITRPLKLDMPDVLKTVPSVIQRGVFAVGDHRMCHVYGALYGSRDLIHWQLVHSSIDHYIRGQHGTPYKYFRLALICNLADRESLFGCSMVVVPRDTNNLR